MRGLRFKKLKGYRIGVIVPKDHRLARRRAVALRDIQAEPLVVFSRAEYSDYHCWLAQFFKTGHSKLRIAQECDGVSSLIAGVEAGAGIAVSGESILSVAGARLAFARSNPRRLHSSWASATTGASPHPCRRRSSLLRSRGSPRRRETVSSDHPFVSRPCRKLGC